MLGPKKFAPAPDAPDSPRPPIPMLLFNAFKSCGLMFCALPKDRPCACEVKLTLIEENRTIKGKQPARPEAIARDLN